MYSQVNSNGHHTLPLKEITNHTKSAMAVLIDDKFVASKTFSKSLRKTTKGYYFLCLWKYGSTMWDPLKDPNFVIIWIVVCKLLITFLAGLIPMFGCVNRENLMALSIMII